MQSVQPEPIRPGDTIDVRTGPDGGVRRGTVVDVRSGDPPSYDVAWADGTSTRLYASARLVTVIDLDDGDSEPI